MENELLDIIKKTEAEKQNASHLPVQAMFIQDILPALRQMAKEALNKLVKEKKVKWSRTINDDAFKICDDGKTAE